MVLKTINELLSSAGLSLTHARVLIAVSGGADSMACLKFFIDSAKQWQLNTLAVAHLDHGLRGADSLADSEFVAAYAQSHNLTCYTRSIKGSHYSGPSLENYLRNERYCFFETLVAEHSFDYVITAHTANDVAESLLMRLERGVGFEGLEAIHLLREKLYLRPLLQTTREEILQFLNENHVPHREDASNADQKFRRNYVRHTTIPALLKTEPNLIERCTNIAYLARQLKPTVQHLANTTFHGSLISIDTQSITLNTKEIRHLLATDDNRDLLFIFLNNYWKELGTPQLEETTFETMHHYLSKVQTGASPLRLQLKKGWLLAINSHFLYLGKPDTSRFLFSVDFSPPSLRVSSISIDMNYYTLEYREIPIDSLPELSASNPLTIYLDKAKLPKKCAIRNKNSRDVFSPLGICSKTRKLTKFLSDRKVLKEQQQSLPLLTNNNDIIWVIGYQISDNYKVDHTTKHIIEMSVTCKKTQ
ncbi:MAG: tRNA lysidine(34) synthetase TilS [Fibrobacterales bacterium]